MGSIWFTADGTPYSKLVDLYGVMVSAGSEEHRRRCEAVRILLEPTKTHRVEMIEKFAKKRGGTNDKAVEDRERKQLQADVMIEWNWRRKSAETEAA